MVVYEINTKCPQCRARCLAEVVEAVGLGGTRQILRVVHACKCANKRAPETAPQGR